jgi:topoisomerase IV subunit A
VAAANQKLYVNRAEGFIGVSLKKDEFVTDCSDIDDIIVFRKDGFFKVVRVDAKVFVGKDILHIAVFRKDDRTVYNMVYTDGKSGKSMVKRFQVTGITREKENDLTMGNKGSKVLYLASRPNGESEIITITLTPASVAKNKVFDYDFSELAIKGRTSQGNILTVYPIKGIKFKALGSSSLGGTEIYYDETTSKLNTDKRGRFIGNFNTDDKIVAIYKSGEYELTNFDLTNRYDNNSLYALEKFNAEAVLSIVHFTGDDKTYYVKRFRIEANKLDTKYLFISDTKNSRLELCTTIDNAEIEVVFASTGNKKGHTTKILLKDYIDIKGWKAIGNKLASMEIESIKLLPPKVEKESTEASLSLFDEEKGDTNVAENDKKEDDNGGEEGLSAGTTLELF